MKVMKWIVEQSRYLSLISVFAMLIGAVTSLVLGLVKTFKTMETAFFTMNESEPTLYVLFEALDCFLVATALIVIAVSLYELFIGGLKVPDWMLVTDLTELKAKFSFVIIPVMAVKFVQKILKYENSLDTLYYGLAIGFVALTLTAFNLVSIKEKEAKEISKLNQAESEVRAADLSKK